MSRRMRILSWLLVALLPRLAAAQATGGVESNLSLGAGSRAIALAGAGLADLRDASAVYWNPAALAFCERGDLALMHAPIGLGDAIQTFVGVSYPTLQAGSFGLGMLRLATGGVQGYDAASNPLGEFEWSETALYLSYAARPRLPHLGRSVGFGLTAKTLTQQLEPWSSTGTGLDVGLQVAPEGRSGLRFAAVLRDAVAPSVRLDQDADRAPMSLQMGASCRFAPLAGLALGLHVGVDRLRVLGWSPRLGLELSYRERLHLRVGHSRLGLAFGVGLVWQRFSLDYAYVGRAGAVTQPASLGAAWGAPLAVRRDARLTARQGELRSHLQSLLEARLARAQAAYEGGDYAAALDEWKVVAGLDPTDERAHRGVQAAGARLAEQQARLLADQGQAAARAAKFEMALRAYGTGDHVLARNVLQELVRENPDDAEARRYLDKTEEALRAQVASQAERARKLEAGRDWVGALALWTQVRVADALHPEAEPALGRCRAALERQAAPRVERPAMGSPAPSRASQAAEQYRDALAAYAAGDMSRAAALLRDVQKLDPGNRAAADLLAKAERATKPLGAEDRARVRELYLRGMGFFTANEFDKAIGEWTRILELDPANTSVADNIREARERLRALQR